MKRFRICKLCGDLHDLSAWPDNHRDFPPARSNLSAPYFISDQIDDLWHPTDGKIYDSKSEFRKTTRINGREEIGTDIQSDKRYTDTVTSAEVAEAMHMVEQGYKPAPIAATADDMASVING